MQSDLWHRDKLLVVLAVGTSCIAHMDLGEGSLRTVGQSYSMLQLSCSTLPVTFQVNLAHHTLLGSICTMSIHSCELMPIDMLDKEMLLSVEFQKSLSLYRGYQYPFQ